MKKTMNPDRMMDIDTVLPIYRLVFIYNFIINGYYRDDNMVTIELNINPKERASFIDTYFFDLFLKTGRINAGYEITDNFCNNDS